MNEKEFRNMVDDPYLRWHALGRVKSHNFCACGLNATGDVTDTPPPIKARITNIKAIGFAKTALAIVGLYVVVSYVYKKWIK